MKRVLVKYDTGADWLVNCSTDVEVSAVFGQIDKKNKGGGKVTRCTELDQTDQGRAEECLSFSDFMATFEE